MATSWGRVAAGAALDELPRQRSRHATGSDPDLGHTRTWLTAAAVGMGGLSIVLLGISVSGLSASAPTPVPTAVIDRPAPVAPAAEVPPVPPALPSTPAAAAPVAPVTPVAPKHVVRQRPEPTVSHKQRSVPDGTESYERGMEMADQIAGGGWSDFMPGSGN